jgi:hypothetical protein
MQVIISNQQLMKQLSTPSVAENGRQLEITCTDKQFGASTMHGDPVFTLSEISALTRESEEYNEAAFVALVTPKLMSICANIPDMVLVNGEDYKWIRTASGYSAHEQKPDLFLCHQACWKSRTPPAGQSRTALFARQIREDYAKSGATDYFRYGTCAWELRHGLACMFEAKLQIETAKNYGEIHPKVQNLLLHAPLGSSYVVRVVLFDKKEFRLLTFSSQSLVSVRSLSWIEPGSRQDLQQFLSPTLPLFFQSLSLFCMQNHITLMVPDAFLGNGATGYAFRVKSRPVEFVSSSTGTSDAGAVMSSGLSRGPPIVPVSDGHVLKISNYSGASLVTLEFRVFSEILEHVSKLPLGQMLAPLLPRLTSPLLSHRLPIVHDSYLAVGFTFGPVGASMWVEYTNATSAVAKFALFREIVAALVVLNQAGVMHGDARLENLIIVDKQLMWIDFQKAIIKTLTADDTAVEFLVLAKSLFPSSSVETCQPFLDHYWQVVSHNAKLDTFADAVWAALNK